MNAPIIQTTYQQLEAAAQHFDEAHGHMERVSAQVTQKVASLRSGGWLAEGAAQFYREFDQNLEPALSRLQAALTQAAQVTREISRILQAAEEEAAAHLTGDSEDSGALFRLASFTMQGGEPTPNDPRVQELIERFRNRGNEMNPVFAGMVGALPLAGGAAMADSPFLPFGDLVGLGILGVAALGGLYVMATSGGNVDEEKVGNVIGESEAASGNVTSGETVNDDEALQSLDNWVGDDYEEIAPGVFRSRRPNADGSYNQGRIDNNSLEGNHPPDVPHIHLERVRPVPGQPGRFTTESNNHVPLGP